MSAREESWVETPDGVLHVVSEGQGPNVVVLHGFSGCALSMSVVARVLCDAFRVHSVDLLGFGESASSDDPAAYTMPRCIHQLERLQDPLRLQRAHWLGYSMGGRVALSYAVARPGRVASLTLVGATAGPAEAAARAERVAADEVLARRILDEGLEVFVDEWMALPIFASQKRLGEEALECARRQRLDNRPDVLAASLRGMGTGAMPALHDALPSLDLPVLVVVGDEDAKFQRLAAQLATALPDARVATVPQAGHAAHLEQPEAFAQAVRSFLAQAGDPQPPH